MIVKVKTCPSVSDGHPHSGHPWLHGEYSGQRPLKDPAWYDCPGLKAPLETPQEAAPQASPSPTVKTGRERVLDDASRLVLGDRDEQYGSPLDNFARAAAMLNAGGYAGPGGRELNSADVAKINILLKMARAVQGDKLDTITDVAGYAACWGEVAHPNG